MSIVVIQKPTAHWRKGPWTGGYPTRNPRACVLHRVAGSIESCISWFKENPRSVSAHFAISLTGTIYQFVSIHDIANHAGIKKDSTWAKLGPGNPNDYTIGIEHEGFERDSWPEPMVFASTLLSAWLAERFRWSATTDYFPLHRWINGGKSCPGPTFDHVAYLQRVQAWRGLLGDDLTGLITNIR